MKSPAGLVQLAEDAKFPAPDEPLNPDSHTTLTAAKTRQIRLFLWTLMDYLKIQYELCGIKPE